MGNFGYYLTGYHVFEVRAEFIDSLYLSTGSYELSNELLWIFWYINHGLEPLI
jgi:hypothetical protein